MSLSIVGMPFHFPEFIEGVSKLVNFRVGM